MTLSPRAAAFTSIALALVYGVILAVLKWVPRYDCMVAMLMLAAVFRLLDGNPRRALALHAITQILLVSFLVHLWTLGYEGRNAIVGGILPVSDSNGYYDDALRLVFGERFLEHSSKRPLFATVLAGFLRLSGSSLRVALLLFALASAWAVARASLEVWRTHGAKSAFVVYAILFFFERRWTGFIQTEQLGLPLGVIGFVLFWRAHARDARGTPGREREWLVYAGLSAISLALMARAGAFFVLPALLWWAARPFSGKERLRVLAMGSAAALAPYAVHSAVLHFVGNGVTFSDYPAIFYGLVHGEDYTYLFQTHPTLAELPVSDRVAATWKIVFDEARAEPLQVLAGFVKSGAGLFTSPYGMFSYVWTNPDDLALEDAAAVRAAMASDGLLGPLLLWRRTFGIYSLLNAGAMGLLGGAFVLGALYALYVVFVRARRDPELSLLRHAMAGVLLSAPFTPPWITSGQQVQTATLAFVAALPAVILGSRRTWPDGASPRTSADAQRGAAPNDARRSRDPLIYVPAVFVGVVASIVAWMRLWPERLPVCAAPGEHLVLPFEGTAVEVEPERSLRFRGKAISDLRFSLGYLGKHNPEIADSVSPYVQAGTVYVSVFDACDARAKIVIDDAHRVELAPSWRKLEATPLASPRVLHAASTSERAP
ncbi:hypothetical protein [Pendulispora albinea]|uniref:Glycosyltransferase RgtA/B/C/D-like domain-containing protein n=1 Tax=Pendulispora albinea TaxID=2741071 RepID=A0ABZ2M5B3_9BACT